MHSAFYFYCCENVDTNVGRPDNRPSQLGSPSSPSTTAFRCLFKWSRSVSTNTIYQSSIFSQLRHSIYCFIMVPTHRYHTKISMAPVVQS